ncbi:DNA replication complex GINS protein PSF1-like [Lineus longissimus]|uniref:DNA replication complex GINS protein PSF1-like n=1 Tax=Lineus longissimus TaxID=88925 RepID=UPI002B4CB233
MFCEKGLELIKELQRTKDTTLPHYNEDGVRQVLEEVRALNEKNQEEVVAVAGGEEALVYGVALRHGVIQRNKRCLLAYVHNRVKQIQKMRWEFGSVLPAEIKNNLCEDEVNWFNSYNKSLANYMRSIGGEGGLDLTQDMKPPKSLYIEVRCLVDHGEFETQDGNVILLKKNSQHFLLRSECENLIRQGILEHIMH